MHPHHILKHNTHLQQCMRMVCDTFACCFLVLIWTPLGLIFVLLIPMYCFSPLLPFFAVCMHIHGIPLPMYIPTNVANAFSFLSGDEGTMSRKAVAELIREADTLAALRHPNIGAHCCTFATYW